MKPFVSDLIKHADTQQLHDTLTNITIDARSRFQADPSIAPHPGSGPSVPCNISLYFIIGHR